MCLLRTTGLTDQGRIIRAAVAGGLFLGLLVVFLVSPANLPVPACIFHSITGHSCLTCGLTRSLHAILHGDLAGSIQYHLFGPVVLLAMLLSLGIFALEAVRGRQLALSVGGRTRNLVLGGIALLWLVYWSIRLVTEFVI